MRVLIVGVFHNCQPKKSSEDSAELRRTKDALENLLTKTIESRQVQFIGEESKDEVETIAKQLADQQNPKIPWTNIDMTDDEEKAAGIFDALQARPFDTDYDDDGRLMRRYHRIPEDQTREYFFIEKIRKRVKAAESILVICGHCHVEGLRAKFQELGDRVDSVRTPKVCHRPQDA